MAHTITKLGNTDEFLLKSEFLLKCNKTAYEGSRKRKREIYSEGLKFESHTHWIQTHIFRFNMHGFKNKRHFGCWTMNNDLSANNKCEIYFTIMAKVMETLQGQLFCVASLTCPSRQCDCQYLWAKVMIVFRYYIPFALFPFKISLT